MEWLETADSQRQIADLRKHTKRRYTQCPKAQPH